MAPAASEIFRPHWTRIITRILAPGVVLAYAALTVGLFAIHWEMWHIYDAVWLNVFSIAIAVFVWRLGSVRAIARPSELTVINIIKRRTVEWAEIVGVSYNPGLGEQYVTLDLDDGSTLLVKAIQSGDGPRALRACTRLRRLVEEFSGPDERQAHDG